MAVGAICRFVEFALNLGAVLQQSAAWGTVSGQTFGAWEEREVGAS